MSVFLAGMNACARDARAMVGADAGLPYEEEYTFSNAVPEHMHGLLSYMTTSGGDMAGPLGTIIPGDGPLKYFLAAALGIAITQIPAALLIPAFGFWKGYLGGAMISGAALTALYLANKSRTSESSSTPQKVG
jgi:hypothetical protein